MIGFLQSIITLYYMRKIQMFIVDTDILENWVQHNYNKPSNVYIIRIGYDTVDLMGVGSDCEEYDTIEDYPIKRLLTLKKVGK